jgi:hypothetical protein
MMRWLRPSRGHTLDHPDRGFVLPVVILLVIIVGATASIMLQRHVARTKTVERQLRAYQEHHGARSLQAVIEAWLKTPTAQARTIADMLEPDGLALTVDPGDGTTVNVYLFPGQDTLLSRITGVREQDREAAQLSVQILQGMVGTGAEYRLRTRPAGPQAVDVNTATPEVLTAIVQAVLGDSLGADRYQTALVDAALSGEAITLQTLSNIATEASIEQDARTQLSRFLTIQPELWRFRIDQYGSPMLGRPLLSRYRGLLLLSGTTSAGGNSFEQPPPFLSWESVNLDEPLTVE